MEQVIYADVLLALNYIVNWLLLKSTARLAGQPAKGVRLFFAALVGAVFSLLIFLPPLPALAWLLAKAGVSLLMAAIAFRVHTLSGLGKVWFLFLSVSLVFAGLMLALYQTMGDLLLWSNGIVYFDISPLTLAASALAAYLLLWGFDRIFLPNKKRGRLYRLTITYQGKHICVSAMEDTGNNLREPFSGLPVVVCNLEAALPLLPSHMLEWFCSTASHSHLSGLMPEGCRIISYSTVGSKGLLPALKPDSMQLELPDGYIHHCDGYLALTESLGKGSCSAVFNPLLVKLFV